MELSSLFGMRDRQRPSVASIRDLENSLSGATRVRCECLTVYPSKPATHRNHEVFHLVFDCAGDSCIFQGSVLLGSSIFCIRCQGFFFFFDCVVSATGGDHHFAHRRPREDCSRAGGRGMRLSLLTRRPGIIPSVLCVMP